MRVLAGVVAAMLLMSFSVCLAQDVSLEKAYSMYYRGEKEAAIQMMEEYVLDNPDPKVYYFLGYAYYEMQDFQKSGEYFDKAYQKEPFYSPMGEEKK